MLLFVDQGLVQHAARVTLVEANGSGVSGTIYLSQAMRESTRIIGDIAGLTAGPHGFHVHMTGATGNNCADAGGHYNPAGVRVFKCY